MTDDCIFCSIAAGEAPGYIVHETDDAVAFLDVNPLARGHTLVVPRAHAERLADLGAEETRGLFGAAHDLVPRLETAVEAGGVTLGVNDGEAAGQEVPHTHIHLVPRFEGDGGGPIHAAIGARPEVSEEVLESMAETIRGE